MGLKLISSYDLLHPKDVVGPWELRIRANTAFESDGRLVQAYGNDGEFYAVVPCSITMVVDGTGRETPAVRVPEVELVTTDDSSVPWSTYSIFFQTPLLGEFAWEPFQRFAVPAALLSPSTWAALSAAQYPA